MYSNVHKPNKILNTDTHTHTHTHTHTLLCNHHLKPDINHFQHPSQDFYKANYYSGLKIIFSPIFFLL